MNPVNATSLYVSASRSVLQCDPRDPRALAELCKLLPFFRQSLSCLVCGNLLQDPIAPTDSSCQHYVCRGCKGQRMQLKPSCSWCKDYSRFQENRQLSLLVHCYRKLCLYIAQSPLAPHIAGAAGDSPDLQAILDEGLMLAESEEKQDAAAVDDAVDSPDSGGAAAAPSEVRPAEEVVVAAPPEAVVNAEVKAEEDGPGQAGVNGLHDCNGLAESDTLRPITIETGGGGGERVVLKSEVFSDQLPVCVSVTAGGGGDGDDASLCEITAFGEELKHSGGSLLLSVEEVLRTLECSTVNPDPDPPDALPLPTVAGPPLQSDCDHHHHHHHNASSSSVPHATASLLNNGPHCPLGPDSSRHTPSLPPENSPRPPLQPHPLPQPSPPLRQTPPPSQPAAANAAPPRCHRKRSRSESDSEKVQPLPIASLLPPPPPPPLGANNNSPHHHPHHHHNLHHHHHHHHHLGLAKREPKFPSPGGGFTPPHHHHHPHLAPVPNGGPPKVGKTVLVSGGKGGLKKAVDHHHGGQKKAYAKARQGGGGGGGVPKPRGTQPHARMPPHPHHSHPLSHPPSPSKPLYKKPVEKKGCKCGRATQNPSVLTCRGQRCPCYSNRKACLDCICRGCQNSYMANGEKKLEAFAVPEKALEQTRLTLGINLTSITAAALRSPATGGAPASGGGNALINVAGAAGTPATPAVTAAAFSISGAGHDSRAFDDSLEMRFDC